MIDLLKYTKRQIHDILLTYYGGGIPAPDDSKKKYNM